MKPGEPCPVCGVPLVETKRSFPNPCTYGVCNRHACKLERKARRIIEVAAKQADAEKASDEAPICDCGTRKHLVTNNFGRAPVWVCAECREKRRRAARRDRGAAAGEGPCWREIGEYRRAQRRWRAVDVKPASRDNNASQPDAVNA